MSQTSHDPASNYMAKGFFFALTNSRIEQQHLQQNITRQFKPDAKQKPQTVAQIGEAPKLSVQEKQEQDCNLAIIRYSQTNSPEDKNQVYALCPEK